MADIFVSYARVDREIVRRIVAFLETQSWSVWWDTGIDAATAPATLPMPRGGSAQGASGNNSERD